MRNLVYAGARTLEWRHADSLAVLEPQGAVVRPVVVALCDLDWVTVAGEAPFVPPFVLGHEGIARVERTGTGVACVVPGDLVVVPFQISCGACAACRASHTAHCTTSRSRTAMYGIGAAGGDYGGLLADEVYVPFADAMLVRVPDGVDPIAIASASDNIVDGYRCVAPFLAEQPGATILVLGGWAGSVALYAVACAAALGAQVDYVDGDAERRACAELFGARALASLPPKPATQYPLVVDGSGSLPALHAALAAVAPEGTCMIPAMYFGETTPLPLYRMFVKGTRLITGRANARPAIPHVLDLVATGRLRPDLVTSRVVRWEDAIEAILAGNTTKLVIERLSSP